MWNKICKGFAVAVLAAGLMWAVTATAAEQKPENESSTPASLAGDWKFEFGLYGFMPAIKGETASGDDFEITFNDILDNLDFTFMSVVGVSKGKWSLLVDMIYLDLSADDAGTVTVPLTEHISITENVRADVGMKSWIVTPAVGYNLVENEKINLTLLAGARYLWMKNTLEVQRSNRFRYSQHKVSVSGTVWDGIVGVRGHVPLTEKWYLPYYFDIGTGDSQLTWQAFGGVGYRFKYFDLVGGYRHIDWNFNDSTGFGDLYVSEPLVGVKFVF